MKFYTYLEKKLEWMLSNQRYIVHRFLGTLTLTTHRDLRRIPRQHGSTEIRPISQDDKCRVPIGLTSAKLSVDAC